MWAFSVLLISMIKVLRMCCCCLFFAHARCRPIHFVLMKMQSVWDAETYWSMMVLMVKEHGKQMIRKNKEVNTEVDFSCEAITEIHYSYRFSIVHSNEYVSKELQQQWPTQRKDANTYANKKEKWKGPFTQKMWCAELGMRADIIITLLKAVDRNIRLRTEKHGL